MQTDKPGSLHEKFGDFGAAPSEGLWNALSENLDQQENRKRRGAFWWWFGGIAAGLLILFSVFQIGVQIGKNQKSNDSFVSADKERVTSAKNNQPASTPENNSTTPLDSDVLPIPATNSNSNDILQSENKEQKVENKRINLDHKMDRENTSPVSVNHAVNSDVILNEKHDEIAENKITEEYLTKLNSSKIELIPVDASDNFDLNTIPVQRRKKSGQWELAFNVGTSHGFQAHNQKMFFGQTGLTTADNLNAENSIQGSGLEALSLPPEITADVKRPLSVEFGVSRTITKRWSIESGINLNFFQSMNTYNAGDLQKSKSNFLSIGIPLALDFDFINKRKFDFSWVAGVNYEFPMLQRTNASYMSFGADPVKSNSFCSGYMISAFTAPRFSVRLSEKLKVGISPGMRFYFHQSLNSEMPVLKRNLWGGVNVGLVWSL